MMALGRHPLMQLHCVEQNSFISDSPLTYPTLDAVRRLGSAQKEYMNRFISKSKNCGSIKKTSLSFWRPARFHNTETIIMEKRQNFKRQLSFPESHVLLSDNRELLDRLVNENWELRQLVCPLSEDCLSVEDYLQKVEARERGL